MPKAIIRKGYPLLPDAIPDRRPLPTLPTNRGRPSFFHNHTIKAKLLQGRYPIQNKGGVPMESYP